MGALVFNYSTGNVTVLPNEVRDYVVLNNFNFFVAQATDYPDLQIMLADFPNFQAAVGEFRCYLGGTNEVRSLALVQVLSDCTQRMRVYPDSIAEFQSMVFYIEPPVPEGEGKVAVCYGTITVLGNGSAGCSEAWIIESAPDNFDFEDVDNTILGQLYGAGFIIFSLPFLAAWGFSQILTTIRSN